MRHSQPWRTNRSRILRANDTSAETKLWAELRNRQLGDLKFVRQAPVGGFFVDFLCRERRIVVELDGGTHSTEAEMASDAARSEELSRLGYRVFRVSNADVFEQMDEVLAALLAFVREDGEK
jgi:very-short-patch-repair endonuclease